MTYLPFSTVMNENPDNRMFHKTEREENKNEKCVICFGLKKRNTAQTFFFFKPLSSVIHHTFSQDILAF